jgi:DNA polymerase epsilon subunit 1
MYDPALQRFLFGLMRKVFLQLLGEFKRLGTQVIYADFNRIFLLTSKPEARSAHAFAQYLVTAATSRELFQDMSFDVINYWDYLAWMDLANFGGIKISPEAAGGVDGLSQEAQMITMDWNIQAYLPPGVQHLFETQVANFIWAMYSAKRKASNGRTPLKAIHNLNAGSTSAATDSVEINPAKQREMTAAQASISHNLTRKLLSVVAKLKKRQAAAATNPDDAELLEFPKLPGSHLNMTNPTLEFVKMVCEVFALAKEMQTEVQILKRNLLDLCGVREFSEEAAFRNPCDALVLPMVICDHCYECRNVDLCRDPDRLPIVEPDGKGAIINPPNRKTWACQVSAGR